LNADTRDGNVFRSRDCVGIFCLGRLKGRVPPCFKIVQLVSHLILGSLSVLLSEKDHTTVQAKTCTVVPFSLMEVLSL
jgi:hypothetical protein